MKAVMLAHDAIKAGSAEVVVAGGMESMTNAPHLLNGSRTGIRYGTAEFSTTWRWDGLPTLRQAGRWACSASCARASTRSPARSRTRSPSNRCARAGGASPNGDFAAEIVAVTVSRQARAMCGRHRRAAVQGLRRLAKIPTLKPAFKKDGTITAASSSSSISDGAAALVLTQRSHRRRPARGLKPLARVVGHATHAQEPEWFTTAPVGAIQKLLTQVGWTVE
jgi:acetyl-CoA C-acetyltransferase